MGHGVGEVNHCRTDYFAMIGPAKGKRRKIPLHQVIDEGRLQEAAMYVKPGETIHEIISENYLLPIKGDDI